MYKSLTIINNFFFASTKYAKTQLRLSPSTSTFLNEQLLLMIEQITTVITIVRNCKRKLHNFVYNANIPLSTILMFVPRKEKQK